VVLALLLVLVLALCLYQGAADSMLDPLRDCLGRTATRFVSKGWAGSLEVGALHGPLLRSPVLYNATLRDAQGTVVAQIAELRLHFNLGALLKKRLQVHRVEIVQPRLTLVQEADGSWNIGKALAPAPPAPSPKPQAPTAGTGLPVAVVVDSLHVRDGELALRLPTLPGVQNLHGLQTSLSAQVDQEGLRAQVQQLTVRASPADVQVHTLQGAVQMLGNVVRIDTWRLQTDQTTITAHGVLPSRDQEAHFEFQMQPLDVTEIGRLMQNNALQGQLHLALQIEGPPAAVQVRSQLRVAEGSMDLHSRLNLLATPLRYSGTLDITHLNLASLVQRAAWQSDITLQLRLDGAGMWPQNGQGEVQLDLHPSHLGNIAVQPSQIRIEAKEQRLQVHRFDLHTSVARLTASGALDLAGPSDLQYALTADPTGLQQLMGLEALAGNIHLQGQASGAWPALNVQGALQARALRYQAHAVDSLQLTYEGTQLGVQPQVTAQLLVRQIHAGTLPVEQVRLDATYQGAERQVHFVTEVAQSANTGGQARGTLTLDGVGQQVVLEALQVRLPDRTWQAVAPLEVVRAPQQLQFKRVHLVHADESIELSGAVDGDRLQDIRLHVAQLDLSYLRQLLQLPDLVGGRATLHIQLADTLAEPRLQGSLRLQPEVPQQLPSEQLQATLVYAQRHLQGAVRLEQANREVLTLDMQLPVNMAFTSLPLEQRLLAAPVEVRLHLKQPHLAALQHWQPALPKLAGTLQGTMAVQGTYAALNLNADIQLQQLGMEGTAEQISAPLYLTGALVVADSVSALAQSLQQGQVAPQVQNLELRIPTLRGQLPAQGAPARPFQMQDVLLQAAGQWTPRGLHATLQRLHVQASGAGLPRTEVLLGAQWTPARLELSHLRIRLPQSEVQGQGYLTLPEQQLQFQVNIPRLQLTDLAVTLPPDLPAVVQGAITLRGSVQTPQVEARLHYAGAQVQANLAAHLQERLPRYQATLRLEGLQLAQVLPAAQGRVQAKAQLQGQGFSGEQRQATFDLSVDTDGVQLAPGLMVRLQASLAGEALALKQLRVRSAPAELVASGTLSATRQVALQYKLTLGDLAALRKSLGMALQARGDLTGEVRGPLEALQTRGTLQLEAWRVAELYGQRLQATFSATQMPAAPQATLRVQLVEVQGPSLPSSSLRLEGNYASQQGTFTVAVTDGPYRQTRLAGKVALVDGQRLTLDTLRLQRQDLIWENVGPVEVVRSPQGTLQVNRLILRSGAQQIRVQGTLPPEGLVQAEVQVQELQIRPTVQIFSPQSDIPDGRLGLNLTLAGTLQQPQLQGELQLTALQWQKRQLGEVRATVGLHGTTVRTDVRWQEQGRELLQIHGTLGTGVADPLNLQIQARDVDLGMLKSFSPTVTHSAGIFRLDLQLSGTKQQPQVQGSLVLRDGELQLVATGERYNDMQARLLFTGNRVHIEQLQVGSRSGPLQLTGQLAYTGLGLEWVDLVAQARQFTAMNTPAIEAIVSMDVQVRGSLQEMAATGSVTVPRARVVLNKLPGSAPQEVQPWELTVQGVYGPGREASTPTAGGGPAPVAAPLPFLRADLQVDMPQNIWLQGPGTAVEMRGALRATKDYNAPFILSGEVETVRGFASYYGKKFVLEKGQVTFTGSPEINPLLDVIVTKKISDYAVAIRVTGKAQQPTLTLSSTPDLPQADVLSLIVVGKTTDRLTSSERTSLSSQAQQVAGDILASQLEKTLGQSLGLDTIEITSGDQLGTGSVKVGRYVTQDIFLSYEREMGAEGNNTAGIEYSINRRLKLKGSSSDTGKTALDLLWRFDY
jgi:autotransporter translocation and assembly factor TamB